MTDLDTRVEEARSLLEEAESAYTTDRQRSRVLAEQAVDISRALDAPVYLAQALDLAGRVHQASGALVEAHALMNEGFELRQALGDQRGMGQSLRNLGNLARWMGNFEESEDRLHQSIDLFTDLKDAQQLARTVHTLHGALVYGGKFAESVRLFEEPGTIYNEMGLSRNPEKPTIVSAFALMHLGRYKEADLRFQKALSLYSKPSIGYAVKNLGRIALVQGDYDEAQTYLLEALKLFRNPENPNGLGQTLGCLGILALRLGNQQQAQTYIHENIEIAARTLIILPSMTALSSAALLRAEEGDAEQAVELYAAALQSGHMANSHWYHDVIGRAIDAAAESVSPEIVERAKERGRERPWSTVLQDLSVL